MNHPYLSTRKEAQKQKEKIRIPIATETQSTGTFWDSESDALVEENTLIKTLPANYVPHPLASAPKPEPEAKVPEERKERYGNPPGMGVYAFGVEDPFAPSSYCFTRAQRERLYQHYRIPVLVQRSLPLNDGIREYAVFHADRDHAEGIGDPMICMVRARNPDEAYAKVQENRHTPNPMIVVDVKQLVVHHTYSRSEFVFPTREPEMSPLNAIA